MKIRTVPSCSQPGKEKKHFEIYTEHSVFLNKTCPQVKLLYQSLTYWNIIRTQLTWGEGNTQLQPPLALHKGEQFIYFATETFKSHYYHPKETKAWKTLTVLEYNVN